jgi:AI-2 transport protein TqsA
VVDLLMVRLRVGRPVAVLLSFVLGLALLSVLGLVLFQSYSAIEQNRATYNAQLNALLVDIETWPGVDRFLPDPPPATSPVAEPEQSRLKDLLFETIQASVGTVIAATAGAMLNILSYGLIVAIFMLFLLTGRATGAGGGLAPGATLTEIEQNIKSYVVLKTVISLFTGGIQGLALWLCGVELAMLWGFLGFLFNFIPNIGPVLAVLAPLPLVALSPNWELGLVGVGLSAVVHFSSGNFVEPKVMGDRFKMHPVAILIGLMFFGMIWGIVGAFLSTPIVAVIKILCDKTEVGRPVGQLIAGRLEPIEEVTRDRRAAQPVAEPRR